MYQTRDSHHTQPKSEYRALGAWKRLSLGRRLSQCALFTLLYAHLSLCDALPNDKNEPLLFHADTVDMNQTTHHGIYTGNVTIDQGSTHISAQIIITDGDHDHQVTKATLKGNKQQQAYYTTRSEADKAPLQAYADVIYYYPVRRFVELVGHAKVTQGNNTITAYHISYDIATAHVITQGQPHMPTTIIIQKEVP